ncbi:MAG: hypothetical protein ACT4NY_15965 [Pseudonocardiales bacterium]
MQHLSAYGSLLITAATAAARDGRRAVAGDLLGSAAEVAHRVGCDRTDYETPFGPSQVTMQTVDVEVVTENYPAALEAALRMPAYPGLPLAARCRHLTDRACAHVNLSQKDQALALLLTVERMAPASSWTAIRAPPPPSLRSSAPMCRQRLMPCVSWLTASTRRCCGSRVSVWRCAPPPRARRRHGFNAGCQEEVDGKPSEPS